MPAEDIKLLTLLSEQLRSELECNLDQRFVEILRDEKGSPSQRDKSNFTNFHNVASIFHHARRRDLHAAFFRAPSIRTAVRGFPCDHPPPGKQCDSEEAACEN